MRSLGHRVLFLAVVITWIACACRREYSADAENLRRVNVGISHSELSNLLGTNGRRHQFSSQIGEDQYLCVSYSFVEPHHMYYFLFKNNVLVSILPRPSLPVQKVSYSGSVAERVLSGDPESRVKFVIEAQSQDGVKLADLIQNALKKKSESMNVLPAFVLTAPLWARAAPSIKQAYTRNKELALLYDPLKINLGASTSEVQIAMGLPLHRVQAQGTTEYIFGSNERLQVNPALRFSGVKIIFRNDIVYRVFSNDFL